MASIFCFLLFVRLLNARIFVYDSTQRTWNNARIFCANYYDGLATILTATDIQNARNKANAISWIGLNDMDQNGIWQWDDGTQCTVTNGKCSDFWDQSEPNGDGYCAEFVIGSSQFNDKGCNEPRGALCNTQTLSPTTYYPTNIPSAHPTNIPSTHPTLIPTTFPTISPTVYPTVDPTTNIPTTNIPTTNMPTTNVPTTNVPTTMPTTHKDLHILSPTISPNENANEVVETTENYVNDDPDEKKSTDQPFYMLFIEIGISCLICIFIVLFIVWLKKRNTYSKNKENMTDTNTIGLQSVSSNTLEHNDFNFILEPARHEKTGIEIEAIIDEDSKDDQIDGLYTIPAKAVTKKGTPQRARHEKTGIEIEAIDEDSKDDQIDGLYTIPAKVVTKNGTPQHQQSNTEDLYAKQTETTNFYGNDIDN